MKEKSKKMLTDEEAYWYYSLFFFGYGSLIREGDKYLENHNLGRAHIRVILVLRQRPGSTLSDLCHFLSVSQQAISRTLKQLSMGGYISQEEGSTDRRQRHLYLTEKGEEICFGLMRAQKVLLQKAFDKVGPPYSEGLSKMLIAVMQDDEYEKFRTVWSDQTPPGN
ncbi:MarR family winged helix-turn-helix transcriptional regulator [Sneathiella chinensis]|uniref:MarR family transcriptional regulator n=2 Tax=Sneathiella chinensis TaxID=349750 RepID=A0ABQ5U6H3_9PROT|nr:MarR family transcriptional regulator [Sneathiella chinensis]GLQ06775.1 MarR family transcriptional regulator [Sneathiella chinensis]